MNSYSLGLTGSWALPIILIILSIGVSFYYYKKTIPPITNLKRTILIALRSIALSILFFILFEPILTVIHGKIEKPKLAVLIDNSISAGLNDSKFNRKDLLKLALKNSNFLSLGLDNLKLALFDTEVYPINFFNDSLLKSNGNLTDISKALEFAKINTEKENIAAVLLITDGAFNTGNNPLYTAELFGKPIFNIGIGDSNEPKDVSVQSLITNEIAYCDNPVPVNVAVKVNGYQNPDLKVTLYDNGNRIAEQSVKTSENTASLSFEFTPKQDGIHKITASISGMSGEITTKNNSMSDYVKVLKNKRKYAIFAGSPGPDLSFIITYLQKEKGVQILNYVQKQGSQFYEKEPNANDLKDVEMIFLVGFPNYSSSENSINLVKNELTKGKPVFFLASNDLNYNKLKALEEFLPFKTISSQSQEYSALAEFSQNAVTNPLLRVSGSAKDLELWNKLPPVFRTETFVNIKPESEKIAGVKVNSVSLKEPMILTRNIQNKKSIAVLAYGIYRWKLLGYASDLAKGRNDAVDLFDNFMGNSMKWLSVDINNKNFSVRTTKKFYSQGERIEFIGNVYDASFNPLDNANIDVKINGNNLSRNIVLNSLGNGRYQGFLDGIPNGDYSFFAAGNKDNIKLGTDNGRFSVGDIPLEYQNLAMKIDLLRTISQRTGGKFYLPENSASFLNDLKNTKFFKDKSLTIREEIPLWSFFWLLIFALLCFSAEWILRKRFGMI